MRILLTLCILLSAQLHAYEVIIPVSFYGWLDQYSMDTRHSFIGNEACVPTSSVNGMTYLQNTVPFIFDSNLTGVTYQDWENTDSFLIHLMGTSAVSGTLFYRFVYGLHEYITEIKDYPNVQFSGMFPDFVWNPADGFPKPSYITSGRPTPEFLTNTIAAGSATLISIEYFSGGGHEILANGIEWDPVTQTGILYFVDPLDPSETYSPHVPLGDAKQTIGIIEINPAGNLVLHYDQYAGRLPYTGVYAEVHAFIIGALSVGGAAFTPFSEILSSGNEHEIAVAFESLNPTTVAMFPILAILNTSSIEGLEDAFNQMDPSIFNNFLWTEQNIGLQTQHILTSNVRHYLEHCFCRPSCGPNYRLWGAPYGDIVHRESQGSHPGYRATSKGVAIGLDYLPCNNLLLGVGGSFAQSHLRINSVDAHGDIESAGAFIYAGLFRPDYWLDLSFVYFNNRVQAKRSFSIASTIPVIPSFENEYKHKNHSPLYMGHLGGNYNLLCACYPCLEITVWPFLNLDYIFVHQNKFEESGGTLALTVNQNSTHLFLPELGLGCTLFFPDICGFIPFIEPTVSYAQPVRFGGKKVSAFFTGTPNSDFKVTSLYPLEGAICPGIIIGLRSPCDLFRIHLSYDGVFDSHNSVNEISGEISWAF